MFEVAKIKHQKAGILIAGALSSLGFPPFYAVPLFVLSLIFTLFLCDRVKTYRHAALIGYLYGFGFFTAGFYWVANALLVDALTFGWLYPIALLGLGAFFGLFFILPFIVWHTLNQSKPWAKVIGFTCTFVLMEYLRSLLLTGFPWNMLGTMFAFSDVLIQTASLIGCYGLSFALLVLVGSVYVFIKAKYKSAIVVFLLLLCLMTCFGVWRLSFYNNNNSNLKVRLVQPSIAQRMKWNRETLQDNLKTYINMSRQKGFEDIKFVVWGETATAFNPKDSAFYKELIKRAVPQKGYLMTGLLRYDEKNDILYNSMSVIDENGETIAFYDKNHLVPFGEYIPFRKFLPKWIKPVANQIADFSRGEKYKILNVSGLPKFGALICYEVIFEDEVINRKNKPQFLVVFSNDGWYGKSSGPYQHLVSARMRATEEGITIIRAANSGISAVINPLGQSIGQIDLNKKDVLDVYLPARLDIPTIYSKIGGKNIQYIMLIMFILLLWKNKLNKS